MLRSGMGPPSGRGFQRLMNSRRTFLAMCNGIHHFTAAVHAVSAGKVFWIRSLPTFAVNHNAAVLQFEFSDLLQEIRFTCLGQGFHHHTDVKPELRAWNGHKAAAAAR